MTVKITHGLLGKAGLDPASPQSNQNISQQISKLTSGLTQAAPNSVVSAEATIVNLKTIRSTSSAEKIRDPEEAQEVAKDVADRIREDGGSLDAHGAIDSTVAREHVTA